MKTSQKSWKLKTHRRQRKSAHSNRSVIKNQKNLCTQCINRGEKRTKKEIQRWTHPDIQKYLKITKSKTFGRCIRAAQSIEVGKTVMSTIPFATAVKNVKNVPYCLTCHAVDANVIPCKNCSMAWFCNARCRNANHAHQYECGTKFHEIKNLDAKCAIQIVLEAMTTFNNLQDLSRFVKKSFKNRHGIPGSTDSKASRLDCILKLQTGQFKSSAEKNEDYKIAMHAYQMIATYPKVRKYFQLDGKKEGGGDAVLIQLLSHNVPALVENGFNINLQTKMHGELKRILLYDILSYMNHSCSPNLINIIDGNLMTCITSQHIQRGEQMFISYRPFDRETDEKRQHELSNWDFVCQCVRCEYYREINQAEFKRANRMSIKEIEKKLNRPYDWNPQKGAYIIRYRRLLCE